MPAGSWGRTLRQPLLRIVPVVLQGYVIVTEIEAKETPVDKRGELVDMKVEQFQRTLSEYATAHSQALRARVLDAVRGENQIDEPLREEGFVAAAHVQELSADDRVDTFALQLQCVDCTVVHVCTWPRDPEIAPGTVWRCAACYEKWLNAQLPRRVAEGGFGTFDAPLDNGKPARFFR